MKLPIYFVLQIIEPLPGRQRFATLMDGSLISLELMGLSETDQQLKWSFPSGSSFGNALNCNSQARERQVSKNETGVIEPRRWCCREKGKKICGSE